MKVGGREGGNERLGSVSCVVDIEPGTVAPIIAFVQLEAQDLTVME